MNNLTQRDKEHGIGLMFRMILLATCFLLLLLMHQYTNITLVHPALSITGFLVCLCFYCMGRLTHNEIRKEQETSKTKD